MARFRASWLFLFAGFASAQTATPWQSAAEWHRTLKKAVPGSLLIGDTSVEFRSPKFSYRWSDLDIKTFDLIGGTQLTLTDYENRDHRLPGERRFEFTLKRAIPADLAAALTARVGRPSINGVPAKAASAIAEIPAHRREFVGASNGTLRFRDDGIDYVATDGRNSRSWRWSDIQTLGNPNPWEFRVDGYREVAEFDLKRPMARELFDRVWDLLYAKDLNLAPAAGVHRHE